MTNQACAVVIDRENLLQRGGGRCPEWASDDRERRERERGQRNTWGGSGARWTADCSNKLHNLSSWGRGQFTLKWVKIKKYWWSQSHLFFLYIQYVVLWIYFLFFFIAIILVNSVSFRLCFYLTSCTRHNTYSAVLSSDWSINRACAPLSDITRKQLILAFSLQITFYIDPNFEMLMFIFFHFPIL